ncbi:MAG: hypothetical protein M3M88_03545 [Thermoproteota archaeon]|nr:hypothetical protein [Thermoproteota archaeon]
MVLEKDCQQHHNQDRHHNKLKEHVNNNFKVTEFHESQGQIEDVKT